MSSNEGVMNAPELTVLSENVIGRRSLEAPRAAAARGGTAELTVVVPTYNERDNVEALFARLDVALAGINWEVIYIDDDSPDGTADAVRQIAQSEPRVRCLQRIGRRGLSSAVIEGMLASSAPYLAVIDADLQHDERLLPQMLSTMKADDLDVVVGSRHVAGGGTGTWNRYRAAISNFATRLARLDFRRAVRPDERVLHDVAAGP